MDDCIFCKIVSKQIPADIKYEDEHLIVFQDIAPKAPVHWLIVPKQHVASMQDLDDGHTLLAGYLFSHVATVAELAGVAESGYRIVSSTGVDGGQTVPHLHVHLFGGEKLPNWF